MDLQRYHVATVLKGCQGWAILVISGSFSLAPLAYNFSMARIMPMSPRGRISGIPRGSFKRASFELEDLLAMLDRYGNKRFKKSEIFQSDEKFGIPLSLERKSWLVVEKTLDVEFELPLIKVFLT